MKRIISWTLALCMVISMFSIQAFAVDAPEDTPAPTGLLPVQALPELDFEEGMPYVGFATVQSELPEEGLYTMTLRRTGDISVGSAVVVETVDISARYGVDYEIKDDNFTTEVFETSGTVLELSGDEANRLAAAEALNEMRENIMGSMEEPRGTLTLEEIPDGTSLAALKAQQSGQPVRETYDTEFVSLAESFVRSANTDVADYVETSSKTRIEFAPGEDEKTLSFCILEDSESEGQELFNLLLSADDDHSAAIEAVRSLSFTIADDEPIEHSLMSLSADEYYAEDGRAVITVTRETALYSYVTAGIRTVSDGSAEAGINYSKTDLEVVLQPYQDTAVVEIPVAPGDRKKTFSVELYDLKGGDEGDIMSATVTIPAQSAESAYAELSQEADDSYLDLFDEGASLMGDSYATSITIDKQYKIVYNDSQHPSIGTIMDGKNAVGLYIAPESMDMFTKCNEGSGHGEHTYKVKTGDGNNYVWLVYYSSYIGYHGWSGVDYTVQNPGRYRVLMLDMYTNSRYNASHCGMTYRTYDSQVAKIGGKEIIINGQPLIVRGNEISKDTDYIGGINKRALRLGTTLYDKDKNGNFKPRKWPFNANLRMWVERYTNDLNEPEAEFYGTVLLYKEFRIGVEDPDTLEYRSGQFDANGKPIMNKLKPAKMTVENQVRYAGQLIQMREAPADGNEAVYGELVGYKIKPLKGTEFTIYTNSTTIELNDELIKQIEEHTNEVQKGNVVQNNANMVYTQLTIKPIYTYKNVKMGLEAPDGLPEGAEYHYVDPALELQRVFGVKTSNGMFHVGDKLNLTMTTTEPGYYFKSCWHAMYVNPGDTAYDTNRSGELPVENGITPTPVIVYTKCVGWGIFTDKQNCIEIDMDENAQKYFTVRNLVPQNQLTESYMKGRNILNTAKQTGTEQKYSITPVSTAAYSIVLDSTAENDGTWRPVISFPKTGQKVNGFAADFIAGNSAAYNYVKITAEKVDPAKYGYFSVDGSAVYSSYALRPGSEKVTSSPAMQAVVTGGGGTKQLYNSAGNLTYQAFRSSTITGDDGAFRLNGILAMDGDTISVMIDNNDVQQVEYITLNTAFKEKRAFSELAPGTDESGNKQNIGQQVEAESSVNALSKAVDMPIRTFYSPYVSGVYFAYRDHFTHSQYNQVPIYDDELTISVNVVKNGADISGVKITKIGRNGNKVALDAIEDGEVKDVWFATFGGSDMADGDRFYVQLTATPEGGSNEITYTQLDTGLVMFTPDEMEKPQYVHYSMPNPYKDLPVLSSMAGDVDSGTLSWKTIYADEANRGTSNYAQIITLGLSTKDISDDIEKLDKIKNGKTSKATQSWEDMMGNESADVYKYLDANEKDAFLEEYQAMNPGGTEADAEEFFNSSSFDKENYRNSIMAGAKKDALCKTGDVKLEASVKVLLQLEYVYDVEKRTHYYSGGQYIINFTVNASKTWYWTIYGVPVFLNINGSISLQFDGRYATEQGKITAKEMGYYEDLTEAVENEWPWFQFGLNIKLQPGIGICGILSARGVFKFTFVARVNIGDDTQGGTMGEFSGGVGVDLVLFSFDYTIGKVGWKSGVFDKKASLAEDDVTNYEESMIIRAFDPGKESSNMAFGSTLFPTANDVLLHGSMEYARPEIVDLGGNRVMIVFLRNDPNGTRDDANGSTLVYAIRDNYKYWPRDEMNNVTSAVIEEDSGADSTPAIMRVGDKVYVAWTTAGETVSESGGALSLKSAKESLQSTNIHMAVYDIDSDTMSAPIAVTNDSFLNSHPVLAEEGDCVALYYFKRDINGASSVSDLVGLTNNYNTWAKKVYDPAADAFIDVMPGKPNPKEEYIYIKHPTITDPLVMDLDAEDFEYTDADGVTKEYCFRSYSIDRDENMETAYDREVWVQVINVTDGRTYYPVPIDAQKDSILDPRLTKLGDDVYLTWLTDDTVLNTISAEDIFLGLNEETATGERGLAVIRGLSDDEIATSSWYKLPSKNSGTLAAESEIDSDALSKLAVCDFENNQKDFGYYNTAGNHEGQALTDHQIVAGGDGNLYLFWTAQDNDDRKDDCGRELFGAALCVNDTYDIDDTKARTQWSDGVQLTNYGKVIDEITVCVGSDKGATLVGNFYKQTISEDGSITYSDHELTQISFEPGNSLEFLNGRILLSDAYPVEGEKVMAIMSVVNNGLLPAERYELTVNGDVIIVADTPIDAGQREDITREFTAGAGGELTVNAKIVEMDGEQYLSVRENGSNQAAVSTKSGAVMDFGAARIYSVWDDIMPEADVESDEGMAELRESGAPNENSGRYEVYRSIGDEKGKLIAPEILDKILIGDSGKQFVKGVENQSVQAEYVACVPVTNIGNLDGRNLSASAVVVTERRKEVDPTAYGTNTTTEVVHGDVVGTCDIDLIPVKTVNEDGEAVTETLYAVIPLTGLDFERDMNEMGVFRVDVQFTLDGVPLEESRLAEYQVRKNVELTVNDGEPNVKLKAGDTAQLQVSAFPWDGIKEISYEVADPTVAAVSMDGKVAGLKAGTTTITVEDASSESLSKEITVVVTGSSSGSGGGGGGGSAASSTAQVSVPSSVENGSVKADKTNAAAGQTVTLTVTPNAGYRVDTVSVKTLSGKTVSVMKNADGTYSFTMPDSKVTVDVSFEEITAAPASFVDVAEDTYYSDAVQWAAANEITNGVDDTHFAPDNECTRAQTVTFLWRAAGEPEPETAENPFYDVDPNAYYYKAVMWAYENGVTKGTSDTEFSPDAVVSRAQTVTFMFRALGEKTDAENPFGDVAEGTFYCDAVLWAYENGITKGTSDTEFSPDDAVTRAQIVTFLYRAYNAQ